MPRKLDLSSVFFSEDWWEAEIRPKQILSQKFATVLSDEDLSNADIHVHKGFKIRPRMPASMKASGSSEVKIDKDGFRVSLDLDEFELGELCVKTFDRFVEVYGRHEDKSDQFGLVSREFRRQYIVPYNCDIKALTSSFSTDCKLTIKAPVNRREQKMFNLPMQVPVVEINSNQHAMELIKEHLKIAQQKYDKLLETNLEAKSASDLSERDVKPEMNLEMKDDLMIIEDMVRETFNKFYVTDVPPAVPPTVEPPAVPPTVEPPAVPPTVEPPAVPPTKKID